MVYSEKPKQLACMNESIIKLEDQWLNRKIFRILSSIAYNVLAKENHGFVIIVFASIFEIEMYT